MSDESDIARYYDAVSPSNPEPDFGLAYTCNCGWIDAGHARPGAAANLWRQMQFETNGYSQNGVEGFKVSFSESASKLFVTVNESKDYFVKKGLSNAEKERVALSIFQEVSLGFEAKQGAGFVGWVGENIGSGSSFSEEDLVSNLVGFYRAVRGDAYKWHRWCKPVSRQASLDVWKKYGATGNNKNKFFMPNLHPCDECTETQSFPFVYNTIVGMAKGIWHFDFDPNRAIAMLNPAQIEFQNRLFNGSPLLDFGFNSAARKIELVVQQGESPYFLARRALMQAASSAGLPFFEQNAFADAFFPLNKTPQQYAEFKMGVRSDPLKTDQDGSGQWDANEFKKLYGKTFTYHLSDAQYADLKARRARNGFNGTPDWFLKR